MPISHIWYALSMLRHCARYGSDSLHCSSPFSAKVRYVLKLTYA